MCARHLDRFMRHVLVRGDDPLAPSVVRWAPWPHLVERNEAWAAGCSEVVLKGRQLGFTWDLAAYILWRARAGWAVGVVSKGQDEARALLERIQFIERSLPPALQCGAKVTADSAIFQGGGSIRVFPSTPAAGISYTFQLVVFDEFAFHPYGSANYAAIQPTISAGGQVIITSTADPELGPSGAMYDMYWASKRGETGYSAVFVPWSARPGRDAAWLERQRRAFTGLPEAFDAYYASSDAQAFVGRAGLVYPMFSAARHVAPAQWEWADSARRVIGVDFGGGDPTAAVALGMSGRQHVHQFGEFYRRGPVPVSEIAGFIARWVGPGRVMCDPSEPVAIATLAEALRDTSWEVLAADNRRGEGLGMVGFLLDADRLTIEPSNTYSIAEFPGYRWLNRTDPSSRTRYATSTPIDNHADAMDARRYAVLEILALLYDAGVRLPILTLAGRPLAKVAV